MRPSAKAGYATDPEYAKKLSGAINSALRVQRAGVMDEKNRGKP